ncbi:phytanoyl-CoA dioxygenase family protein [Paenibacillus sp. CF384]|uniref:phytanoyl-CoA dioxygenase family protein n=1 Tax=Paenibacillus sp. CF384 TaxID=1884382 RepID=UPI000896A931|nr:phytanoyl-CoA dioxygenase family protein [Paenibacillus sp. CF384]SDW19341.1 Ectoine hydroxylase-related dioxygenase, phytanoyl-CoA dioxygenase (PhyH) family [Paenibacillus sp. CF384]
MLNAEQLKQYHEQGYVILDQLFTAEEMDRIRAIIDVFDWEGEEALKKGSKGFNNIPNQINFTCNLARRHEELEQFIGDQRFVDLTTSVLGGDIRLYWDQSVYKRPEAKKDFPWHQDNGYVPTDPVHYMTCWLALDDATIENGCIYIQPGSHLQGYVEHVQTDTGWQCYFGEDPGQPVPLPKGSMVIFHSLLFHRSTPNQSDSTRKAYVIQYSVEGAKNPVTGKVFDNGPLIAQDGRALIAK